MPQKSGLLHRTPVPIQITSSPMLLAPPVPAKDGKKLFVVGVTDLGELSRYDRKTGQFVKFLGGISAEYVALSHDNQRVAYVSYPEGTLWRMRRDGTERVQLTYPTAQALLPRWSPDDKNLVFYELNAGHVARMYVIAADGATPRPVLRDDTIQQADPNWSPDGTKIVFGGLGDDAHATIRVMDLSSHQISVVPGSEGMFGPRLSPTGRYIVANSMDSKKLMLYDATTEK